MRYSPGRRTSKCPHPVTPLPFRARSQTPQTFRVEVIRRAISAARENRLVLTDDTAACELIGQPVRLVKSASPNPKVTVPADLQLIESLLQAKI